MTRGTVVEIIHCGAIAVVDSSGKLAASYGDPTAVANLRSSSKPFQALPLLEGGGLEKYNLSNPEIAVMCASHSGTPQHIAVLQNLQQRLEITTDDLLCGIHYPLHEASAHAMQLQGEPATTNHNNCSGKHTGMLAQARLRGLPLADYTNTSHPVQKTIVQTFAEMCNMPVEDVEIGIDGCSAPTFAVPLVNAAFAYARLVDPKGINPHTAQNLRCIAQAMVEYPEMVAGPERFDTLLMQTMSRKVVCKGGADGYQAFGVFPGAAGGASPGLGVTIKVIDGDATGRARPLIALEILRQLGVLTREEQQALSRFDRRPVTNWRGLEVGVMRPVFNLDFHPD
jgi:L-asparaginase II